MEPTELLARLTSICERYVHAGDPPVIVPEPYIPYIPDEWNGTLVVAESQNLAGHPAYAERLRSRSRAVSFQRLYHGAELSERPDPGIGVAPWDDDTLKLAVLAAFDEQPERFAVSNAVPWSRGEGGRNLTAALELRRKAVKFWGELLAELRPRLRRVVTVGSIARKVMRRAGWPSVIAWSSASPRIVRPLSALLSVDDLRRSFPDVVRAAAARFETSNDPRARERFFYACHAVSKTRGAHG